ncbi:MAG: glycosyltransferase family 2 protein [Patescibacteria group bacterium]|nr:glycosyltransferase family 2 protein [Patescibacteria group bacterium]
MKISAVVLAKNEEKNIEKCLKSLDFCDEIIVVDDYSEDKTIEKVKSLIRQLADKIQNGNVKLRIYKRNLENNFAEQKNFGLKKSSYDWVLFVDADEQVSEELKKEIVNLKRDSRIRGNDKENYRNDKKNNVNDKEKSDNDVFAFYIKRRDYFWGREVKYGEVLKARKKGFIRLVNKKFGSFSGNVHEEFKLKNQSVSWRTKIKTFNNYLNHYPHQTLKEFIKKINFYSTIRANELYQQGKKTNIFEIIFYPLFKFVLTYFIFLGFLDKAPGFIYSFLMSFHSFLVRAKLYQLNYLKK